MKFKKLTGGIPVILTAIALSLTIIACNSDNGAGKTSTNEPATDTSLANSSSTGTRTEKRKGKVTTPASMNNGTVAMKKDEMGFYDGTETAPAFPGGQSSLEDYITSNIEYPQDAIDNNTEGVVNIKFTIDENGNVGNAKVAGNKLGYGLEDAAIRVVSKMPKWTPGKIKGKNVKAWYTLPIVYKMES